MNIRLVQENSQKLILSPQMRQYLKLLQMPAAELEGAVEEAIQDNPIIELKEVSPAGSVKSPEGSDHSDSNQEHKIEMRSRELRFNESFDRVVAQQEESSDYGVDGAQPDPSDLQKTRDFQESLMIRHETLEEFLLWQIRFLDLAPKEEKLAEQIIGALDENGFLKTPVEELAMPTGQTLEFAEVVLQKLQMLDPPGVCARNLKETLEIQLRKINPKPELAINLVVNHFDRLVKHEVDFLSKTLGVSRDEVRKAMALISFLEPKPGRSFSPEQTRIVVPDVAVFYDENRSGRSVLKIELRDEWSPRIRISAYYRKMLRDPRCDETTKKFIREKIQAGMNFIQAMELRGSTLKRIAELLVKHQGDFFDQGFSHLKPMLIKEMAAELGLHESTVSRAISGKYMATPRGVIPMRQFFSNRLETQDGEGQSQQNLLYKVKDLIQKENPKKPLSDQELVKILKQDGTKLARRTVAKYRDILKILPSHLRKQR